MGSTLRVKKGHEAEVYGSLGSTTNWVRVEIVGPKGTLAVFRDGLLLMNRRSPLRLPPMPPRGDARPRDTPAARRRRRDA